MVVKSHGDKKEQVEQDKVQQEHHNGLKVVVALGPKPRSYKYTVNKKEKRLAIRSVLSSKVLEKELTVVDKLELKEIKTKSMVKALEALKVEGKTLIVLPENDKNVVMSARNIEGSKNNVQQTTLMYLIY